jgi:hypothetical protein
MKLLLLIITLFFFPVMLSWGIELEPFLAHQQMLDMFIIQGPVFLRDKRSLKSFREIAPLLSEEISKVPNPHNGTIEFHLFRFDGLEIYGNMLTKSDLFAPIRISVYNSQWPIFNGLNVGVSVSKMRYILGEPTHNDTQTFKYCGETDCVHFTILNGQIDRIDFFYYAD